jgi:hypothetical protein
LWNVILFGDPDVLVVERAGKGQATEVSPGGWWRRTRVAGEGLDPVRRALGRRKRIAHGLRLDSDVQEPG